MRYQKKSFLISLLFVWIINIPKTENPHEKLFFVLLWHLKVTAWDTSITTFDSFGVLGLITWQVQDGCLFKLSPLSVLGQSNPQLTPFVQRFSLPCNQRKSPSIETTVLKSCKRGSHSYHLNTQTDDQAYWCLSISASNSRVPIKTGPRGCPNKRYCGLKSWSVSPLFAPKVGKIIHMANVWNLALKPVFVL